MNLGRDSSTEDPPLDTGNPEADHIRAWALELIRWSEDKHHQECCKDWLIYYRYWKNWVERESIDPDDYHSNIGVGLAWPTMKTLSARMMAPHQAGDWLIDATAYEAMGKLKAERVGAWVNDKLVNRIPRMFSKLELVKESSLALGRGILKPVIVTLPQRTLLKRIMQTVGNAFIPGGVQVSSNLTWQKVPVQRRFTFQYVDPFNWWPIGAGQLINADHGRWDCTVERSFLTTSQIYRMMAADQWEPFSFDEGGAYGYDQYTRDRLGLHGGGDIGVPAAGHTTKPHELIEIQGWVETNRTENGYRQYDQRIVQLLDRKHLLIPKGQTSPGKLATWDGEPGYLVFEPFSDWGGNRPIGLIEPIEQLLLALNDLCNIGFDNARKIIESALMVDPDAVQEGQQILIGPTEINMIRDPHKSVAPLEMKELGPTFDKMLHLFLDLIRQNTGVSETMGGVNTELSTRLAPGLKTARGMQQMTDLATSRFSPVMSKMDRELYRKMAQCLHETGKLRLTDEEPVRLPRNTNSPFTKIGPTDLAIELDFSFNVKALDFAMGRRREEFNAMMEQLVGLAPLLQGQGKYLDAYELARMLMEEFDRGDDAEAIIKAIPMMPGLPTAGAGGPFATPAQPNMLPGAPMPLGQQGPLAA